MQRPRLLDLFCCAGGAGMGYARAGFEITGVDVVRHTNNPHPVIESDALTLDPKWIAANFDAVHASPPCQGYTTMRHAPGAKGAPRLIGATRELLRATGLPWVIENVEAAADEMRNPVLLCGTMFGLGAQGHDLQRHRLFETSFPVAPLACQHTERPVIGVYGGHARNRSSKHGGRGTKDVWDGGHKAAASKALGIDWMTLGELSEAIPPAYTEFLGWQLRAAMDATPCGERLIEVTQERDEARRQTEIVESYLEAATGKLAELIKARQVLGAELAAVKYARDELIAGKFAEEPLRRQIAELREKVGAGDTVTEGPNDRVEGRDAASSRRVPLERRVSGLF